MTQCLRSEARLKIRDQLVTRHEELMAREARIRAEVLEAAAAILKRDRAVLEAETRLGRALDRLTGTEGMPVEEAAELCRLEAREARRLIRGSGQDGAMREPGAVPPPLGTGEVES